ncbi:MAG: hypothetical protein R3362_02410 [Rhodothermales bacterium]|nr:hypothetical protein [Rhodothermales bacterium]
MASVSDDARTQLDGTLSALEGGVTALSPAAARGTIERWLNTLAEHDGLNDVATALGELRDALAAPRLRAGTIGPILSRLGERTTAAAGQAEDDEVARRVRTLGRTLSRAGDALSGRGGPRRTDTDVGTAAGAGTGSAGRSAGPIPQGGRGDIGNVSPNRPSETPGTKYDPK